jgi:divalent metal cation (Fe/Co/Zn/Cd) transporter
MWLRQFATLALVTAGVGLLQAGASIFIWLGSASPVLLVYGLDALVGAGREAVLARRIAVHRAADVEPARDAGLFRVVAVAYLLVGALALVLGGVYLWQGRRPDPSFLGVALAAISMLLVPIIGSYMKSLAMEVRSPALKAAAVFTFGNSYLAMVLLIGLLINLGMQHWWGDALGAVVMSPFIIQKGWTILSENRDVEFVEE